MSLLENTVIGWYANYGLMLLRHFHQNMDRKLLSIVHWFFCVRIFCCVNALHSLMYSGQMLSKCRLLLYVVVSWCLSTKWRSFVVQGHLVVSASGHNVFLLSVFHGLQLEIHLSVKSGAHVVMSLILSNGCSLSLNLNFIVNKNVIRSIWTLLACHFISICGSCLYCQAVPLFLLPVNK